MALPTLSPEQRQAALDKASASRHHRAEALARLQAGEITFAELLERAETDTVLAKTKVSRALRNVRGVGVAKATRLMSSCEVAENRKLAGLGPRQRQALIDALH
jgi:predicted HAD superfamily phosphohydrolase